MEVSIESALPSHSNKNRRQVVAPPIEESSAEETLGKGSHMAQEEPGVVLHSFNTSTRKQRPMDFCGSRPIWSTHQGHIMQIYTMRTVVYTGQRGLSIQRNLASNKQTSKQNQPNKNQTKTTIINLTRKIKPSGKVHAPRDVQEPKSNQVHLSLCGQSFLLIKGLTL